ncbi:cell division protein FtsA, partial [Candidatus Microgenomates bacterium]|nr:cell division protein FtsA [Candidatus Microgenomates bacterium]
DVDRVIDAAKAISLPTSREIIHVIPRQFIVDGESGIKDPVGMSGVRLEVETHLVTASSAALKNLTKSVNEVGINIQELVFSGLASSFAVLSDTEKELGCVLIDIGGGTTSIAAFVDGALAYSGTLPIGAKNVTNDLAIGLRVQLDPAETIKLALSQPKSKEDAKTDTIDIMDLGAGESKKVSRRTLIEGIIRPRLNEIFTMVRLDLEKKNLINRIPSGAIITGGGALTIAVEESAKRMLSLPVRIGVPSGVTGLIDDIMTPAYATGIGLILYGAQRGVFSQQQNNLSNQFKKIKLPTKGIFGKLTETIKDLLP